MCCKNFLCLWLYVKICFPKGLLKIESILLDPSGENARLLLIVRTSSGTSNTNPMLMGRWLVFAVQIFRISKGLNFSFYNVQLIRSEQNSLHYSLVRDLFQSFISRNVYYSTYFLKCLPLLRNPNSRKWRFFFCLRAHHWAYAILTNCQMKWKISR